MRLIHQTWMSVVLALAIVGGCASRSGLEVLESSMRQQEDRLAGLQQQLDATQNELQISQNEVAQLRAQLAANGQQSHTPEHFENEFKAVGLRFNSYLTSGIDRDGYPGDDVLSVLLYPHDEEGGLVKLPGTVELRAVDLSAADGQQEIGSWFFSPEQTKKAWHTGFLAAGFLFEEAWERPPQGSNITLYARFKTLDGRQFDAIQPLKVALPTTAPLAQNLPLQTKVRTSKPTVSPVGYDARKRPDRDVPGAEFDADDDADEKVAPGIIETSDRYREHELPVIR